MKQYDYLIIGANLYGAVFAYEAKRRNKRCMIIDRCDRIDRSDTTGQVHVPDMDTLLAGIDVQLDVDCEEFVANNPNIANKTVVANMPSVSGNDDISPEQVMQAALSAVKEEFDPMI